MTPPQAHDSFDDTSSAGAPFSRVFVVPGSHGPVGTGMHGMGVNTPSAAAVAAATVGFESEVQAPNGQTVTTGAWSVTFPAGEPARHWCTGSTTRDAGATPKLHIAVAPATTWGGILDSTFSERGASLGLALHPSELVLDE
jgi:hypothetical protein